MGMWDTVGSYGIPALGPRWLRPITKWLNHPWQFHDTNLSTWVDGAFHALAIDEQRAAFEPALWHQQPGAAGQTLKQVWFTGVHSEIGGGYHDTSLSDIALLWIAERAREYGLAFVPGAFSADGPAQMTPGDSIRFQVNPQPMTRPHPSRTKMYRIFQPMDRAIGTAAVEEGHPDGCESLSTTAKRYYDGEAGYRPPGLVTYLAKPNVHLEPAPAKAWPSSEASPAPASTPAPAAA